MTIEKHTDDNGDRSLVRASRLSLSLDDEGRPVLRDLETGREHHTIRWEFRTHNDKPTPTYRIIEICREDSP